MEVEMEAQEADVVVDKQQETWKAALELT